MDQESASRSALMAIRPPYAYAILNGTKRVEFRRRRLASDIQTVFIYVTTPVRAVVGHFTVQEQVIETPNRLWDRFRHVAGIDRHNFFVYFDGAANGVGILIDEVAEYARPRRLDEVDPGARPPQSFKYLASRSALALS